MQSVLSRLLGITDRKGEKVLERLCPSNIHPEEDQKLRLSLLTKDTGQWIFSAEKYIKWLNAPGSFLWLYGKGEYLPLNVDILIRRSWFWENSFNVHV